MLQPMRRLYPRGNGNRGIAVDAEGAMLGPDCVLICRNKAGGYCSISRDEAAALQDFLFGDSGECDWLFDQCQRIAAALDRNEVALAQIFGLYIPIDGLGTDQLERLARAAPFIKANFNPDEPRIPRGQPGAGEWTTGDGSSGVSGPDAASTIPAQITIPWDFPAEIPWEAPGAPSEITPLPFDFPGAERKRPPLPTNPFPRDPECAEEWAAAWRYCDRMEQEGKFRTGYLGPGKDMRSCLLGRVSERCGGNPTA